MNARILLAELEFASIEELQQDSLTLFLERFLHAINTIGDEIRLGYFEAA